MTYHLILRQVAWAMMQKSNAARASRELSQTPAQQSTPSPSAQDQQRNIADDGAIGSVPAQAPDAACPRQ